MLKNLRGVAALFLVLLVSSCASGPPLLPPKPLDQLDANNPSDWGSRRRFGALGDSQQIITWVKASSLVTITGNNATQILYSTTSDATTTRRTQAHIHRVRWAGRADQAIQIVFECLFTGTTTWKTCPSQQNSDGSTNTTSKVSAGGTAVDANVDYMVDFLVQAPDWRVKSITGGTGPSAGGAPYDIGFLMSPELGQ